MKDYTAEDRRVREKLERASPRAPRVNMVDRLNAMAGGDASREMPGLMAIDNIRRMQKHGYKTANRAHERFEKAAGEGFNRLHPESGGLARVTNVPKNPLWAEPGATSFIPGTSVAPVGS